MDRIRSRRGAWARRCCIAAALIAAGGSAASAPGSATPADAADSSVRRPHVLVLTGSDPYLPAFVAIDAAMRSAVAQPHGRSVVWAHESIDAMRFGGSLMPNAARLLQQKYEGARLDAIVLVSEAAVDFHLRYGRELWPGVPVVFHSVAPAVAATWPAGHGLSGLVSEVDFAGAARIARALQPGLRRLLVVAGASEFDQAQLDAARAALAGLGAAVEVEYLVGLTPTALGERLARAQHDEAVLFVTMMRDQAGQLHVPRSVLEAIARSSAVPVYGAYESYVGHGLAAGSIESFRQRGERAAGLLVRAIDGQLASGGVIEAAPAPRCVADGRQLERHGLRAAMLPAGCDLRFVEPTFLERYWLPSVLVALVLAAQSALIAALLLQRRKRRVAEASLQAQRVQLLHASRLAVAGELTASIAHEINQPLAAILANADAADMLLASNSAGRDELRQILADIRRDDLRASEVIKRLRALLARHQTEHRRFDLNRLVEETMVLLRAEARRREIELELRIEARRDTVLGDPVQLQQVVLNLMLNAFDASAALPPVERRVIVRTAQAARGIELGVRDFGSGIALSDRTRVFDPFFSTKAGGMGLGLPISRSIVEAQGGTIEVAEVGIGTELRVWLPLAGDASGEAQEAAGATAAAGPS